MRHRSRSRTGRLILTLGGPFREWAADRVRNATVEEALQHPTWRMGHKITVDCATLANKALELIEAHHLFGLPYDALEVVVHPQSIVHAFVEFHDGSVLAQLGFPSMELPILYALTHPERLPDSGVRRFDPVAAGPLTFEPVRADVFRPSPPAWRPGGPAAPRRPCSMRPTRWRSPPFSRAPFLSGASARRSSARSTRTRPARQLRGSGACGRPLGPGAGPAECEAIVLLTILALIVVLGVLIFVHEAGHFVAAKWAGIYVHRFSLGLGPPIPGSPSAGARPNTPSPGCRSAAT